MDASSADGRSEPSAVKGPLDRAAGADGERATRTDASSTSPQETPKADGSAQRPDSSDASGKTADAPKEITTSRTDTTSATGEATASAEATDSVDTLSIDSNPEETISARIAFVAENVATDASEADSSAAQGIVAFDVNARPDEEIDRSVPSVAVASTLDEDGDPTIKAPLDASAEADAIAVAPEAVFVSSERATPVPETPVETEGEAISVRPSETTVVGKDFPATATDEEKISTQALLRALEAKALRDGGGEANVSWRQGLVVDGEASSFVMQGRIGEASRTDALNQAGARLAGITEAAQSARPLAPTELLAATREARVTGLGTLSAAHQAAIVGTPLQRAAATADVAANAASGPRTGFDGFMSGTFRASPLEAAQRAIQRRAAMKAFLRNRIAASAQESRTALDMANASRFEIAGRLESEGSEARQARMASFVLAERSRLERPVGNTSHVRTSWQSAGSQESVAQAAASSASPATSAAASSANPATTSTQQAYTPLMQYMASEVRRQVRLGKREFRIDLNPASLGKVQVEVVMEDDALLIRIHADSEASQRLLEENLAELETALEEQGMKLDVEGLKKPSFDANATAAMAEQHATSAAHVG